ncbi:MAG: hypothetical protein ACYSWW_09535 [Planctomycetota bacterium]
MRPVVILTDLQQFANWVVVFINFSAITIGFVTSSSPPTDGGTRTMHFDNIRNFAKK